jgi:hypothetical protein
MAVPTRGQIEATITLPTYQLQYWNGSAWVDIADADVGDLQGLVNVGGGPSGFDFGANASPRGTVKIDASSTNQAISWERLKIRIQYGFSTSDMLTRWMGIVTDDSRGTDDLTITWGCAGFDLLISETECYSDLLYRRPPATKTTASSIEDPTSGSYAGGLINYICWQSGGRPYEQSATYPTATFYYSLDNAIITPEWAWIGGENAWQEIDTLCRAVGGQMYQDTNGTMVYKNPLVGTSSGYTFDESVYSSLAQKASVLQKTALARCTYQARRLQPEQEIYADTTPRLILGSGNISLVLDMQRPVYDYAVSASGGSGLPNSSFTAVDLFGIAVVYPDVLVSFTSRSASRVTIQASNTLTQPIVLSNLTIRGRPIAVTEDGQASYGSGTPAREIGNGSIYIQNRVHAERLCRLYVDVYGTQRPERAVTCMYDPDRTLGEIVTLSCTSLTISGSHRITAIDVHNGETMSVTLIEITGLLTTADLFMIDTSYSSGDTRQLSW